MDSIKNEIRLLMINGEEERAFKKMFREKMSNEKKSLIDEIFLNYHIAEYYHKKDNDFKYFYIGELTNIFKKKNNRESYKLDFARYLNLYVDIYRKKISEKKCYRIIKTICNIYKELDNKYFYNKTVEKFNLQPKDIEKNDFAEELEDLEAIHM